MHVRASVTSKYCIMQTFVLIVHWRSISQRMLLLQMFKSVRFLYTKRMFTKNCRKKMYISLQNMLLLKLRLQQRLNLEIFEHYRMKKIFTSLQLHWRKMFCMRFIQFNSSLLILLLHTKITCLTKNQWASIKLSSFSTSCDWTFSTRIYSICFSMTFQR